MQEEIKEIKTVTITEKGQICIPITARNLDGFKEGSKISIIVYNNKVELRPLKKEKMNDALMCMLMSEEVLSKNWLSKKDEEAWKDL
ncbi:AbrB/MazE/SpoVT family DNA-binding domain-containing protein [Candidatus Woesearchaeota archaeon]|nr:AbrB/MazE/SpoVT family DNA-binding domain-containing protein [Candidatus Woesearchaeota archaeon]